MDISKTLEFFKEKSVSSRTDTPSYLDLKHEIEKTSQKSQKMTNIGFRFIVCGLGLFLLGGSIGMSSEFISALAPFKATCANTMLFGVSLVLGGVVPLFLGGYHLTMEEKASQNLPVSAQEETIKKTKKVLHQSLLLFKNTRMYQDLMGIKEEDLINHEERFLREFCRLLEQSNEKRLKEIFSSDVLLIEKPEILQPITAPLSLKI